MPRRVPRLLDRLIALLPPLAAGMALAGAAVSLALAVGVAGSVALAVPVPALPGGFAFVLDPAQAGVLAAVLAAAGAVLLAVRSPLPGAALILAGAAAIAAGNTYTLVFATLIVLVLARHAKSAAPAALAVLPVTLLAAIRGSGMHEPWIVIGAAGLLAGGLDAALTLDLARLARAVAVSFASIALIATGLGDAGAARLAVETAALTAPALAFAAGVIDEATGARSPDWLGGLARGMPRFSLVYFGALVSASMLPPGPGFATFRAAFESALGTAGWPGGLAAVVLGLGFALSGFAAIRAFGMVCLGRPRSLRAAAAEDVPRRVLFVLGFPVGCGLALALRSEPFAVLAPLAVLFALHHFTVRAGPVEVPPFDDGFARPPAWLPFGDPATQINASGLAASLRRLTARLPGAWRLRLLL